MGEEVDLLRQRVDELGLHIQNVQAEARVNRDGLAAALAGPGLGGADPPGGGRPPPGGAGAVPDEVDSNSNSTEIDRGIAS